MQLERIIAQVKRLPATPQLLPRLMQVLKDPNATSDEIVDMVKLDMSVAAQIQRLSNSTYYGFPEPCRDLHQAVTRIGMQETYKLVAAVLSQQMTAKRVVLPGMTSQRIWENSIASALTMETLAQELDRAAVNAYSIGLFHNIGIILIAYAVPQEYAKCFTRAKDEEISLMDAERATFGWDHTDAATALLNNWKFPETIVEPITMQYRPHEAANYPDEAAMIHLTHYLITHLNLGVPNLYIYEETLQWTMERLGLDYTALEYLVEKAREQVGQVREMLGAKKAKTAGKD